MVAAPLCRPIVVVGEHIGRVAWTSAYGGRGSWNENDNDIVTGEGQLDKIRQQTVVVSWLVDLGPPFSH